MDNLVLRVRSDFNGLAEKDDWDSWSTGVLEHWKNQSHNFNLNTSFRYSITPADCRMRKRAFKSPLRVAPSPQVADFFLVFFFRHEGTIWEVGMNLSSS
jgi:hypothetical protein